VTVATETGARLSAATVGRARTDTLPQYDRTAAPCITHLGVGAFMRAHLGVYADDLLRLGHPALIRGVSLHNPHAEEQLVPQDCFYSVAEREPGAAPRLRVIGSITSVATGMDAALVALAAPATRFITLTITEKGYDLEPADPEHPDRPPPAPALIALALHRRRASSQAPPVVAALDNVSANGTLLRARVMEAAAGLHRDLPSWIENEVSFPNSVVDRMVPATSPRDLADIATQLGLVDLGAVTTEAHRSWVMTGDARLEPWREVGVDLVSDATPYEQRKLWLLNGPHSALAYCGLLAGRATIAATADDAPISAFVARLVDDVLEVVRLPAALRASEFAWDALRRFRNPGLGHTCAQVGADGSRKLPQRFGDVVTARLRAGLDVTRFATVVALWIAATAGVDLRGSPLPALHDPDAARLRVRRAAGLDALAGAALENRFDRAFVVAVAQSLRHLVTQGMAVVAQQA
jgi:fructuronate reductase